MRPARSGASGMVFEAVDRRTAKRVAIKVITPPRDDAGFLVRIDREIRILSTLSHPNVVAYQASGALSDGRIYLVLEWLSGLDLSDLKAKSPLTLEHILEIARQIASALSAAHDQGIIHRDIKPSNVFLIDPRPGSRPDVRVLDFGVAKNEDTSSGALTRAGAILGTPAYMAPEQASYAMNVDARADIFSLGVLCYELICGRLPWSSRSDLARLARILTERALSLSIVAADVPREVIELVDQMLAHQAADRPPSMKRVHERLERCLQTLSLVALEKIYVREPEELDRLLRRDTAARVIPREGAEHETIDPEDDLPLIRSSALAVEPSATQELSGEQPRRPPPLAGKPLVSGVRYVEPAGTAPLFDVPDAGGEPQPLDPSASSVQLRRGLPLVGRKPILERLLADVRRALSGEQQAALAVLGPAGIGKTRLRAELSRMLRIGPGSPLVLAGRADEAARSSPYGFLRRLLLAEAKIFPDDAEEVRLEKLERLVPPAADLGTTPSRAREPGEGSIETSEERTRFARVESWVERPSLVAVLSDAFDFEQEPRAEVDDEREVIVAFLAEALQIAGESQRLDAARRDPKLMSAETRRSVELVLRELARRRGLVFLVDDAHLLDRQSALVLRDLLREQHPLPLVVVAFALPTLLDEREGGRAPWNEGRVSMIELPALDAGTTRNLTRLLVEGPIRSDALEVLAQRSGGNPLYLEQLVRAVRETGVLAPAKGGDHVLSGLKGDAQDNERIPPTVAAAVRARYEALDKRAQSALAAAAAFGEVFWAEGVAAVLGEDLEETMVLLDRLTASDFVRRRGSSRYQHTTELELAHSVIRIVVLSRVRRDLRRELERKVVAFLRSAGERDASVLASHLTHAGLRAEAAELYAQASLRSARSGDFAAANTLADEGLLLVESGEVPLEVQASLLDASARAFELSDRLEEADHALELLASLALDPRVAASAGERRSRIALRLRRFEEARRFASEAAERFHDLGEREPELEARLAEAEAAEEVDDDRSALRAYVLVQQELEQADARGALSRASRGLARIALCSGDYRTAESRFRAALVHARAAQDLQGTIDALLGLGVVSRRVGEYERSGRYFEGAERLVTDRVRAIEVWSRRALLTAETGLFGEAQRVLEIAIEEAKSISAIEAWIQATLLWSQLFVGFGRETPLSPPEARAAAERLAPALDAARIRAPALVLPLEVSLSHALAKSGEGARGWTIGGGALGRFEAQGAVREDEAPRLFAVHAGTLASSGAPAEHVREAKRQAVAQLDLILSRLDRRLRERYLSRPLARTVILEAERAGLTVERDGRSHRVRVRSG